ncbi:MAG: dihydrodipicolinate synthase family protein [Chloroflexi bacterium]|nr:dihydrodipicolinate synthase family protein [Chloroflexota bacterium]
MMQHTIPGGIYPPIATPFAADGEVSVEGLKANLARWAETELAGLGSNGEFPYLDDDERDVIVSTVMEAAPPRLRIIVGTGRESTRATIRTTRRAAELGAHAAIIVNPS